MLDRAFSFCINISRNIDPACGSGSLLVRAIEEPPFEIAGYGQVHIPLSECGSTAEIEHVFRASCATLPLKLSMHSASVEH